MNDDSETLNLDDRLKISTPPPQAKEDDPRLYYCAYCPAVLNIIPTELRICQDKHCIEQAIADRQQKIEEIKLTIPGVRKDVEEEANYLVETIESLKKKSADPELIEKYQHLLNNWLNFNRFYAVDNRQNKILQLQDQIEELVKRVNRPSFSEKFRKQIWKRDKGKCYICKKSIKHWDGQHMQIDHVKPRSQGGSDREHNLRAAHPSCNRAKSDGELSSRKLKAVLKQLRKSEEEKAKERLF